MREYIFGMRECTFGMRECTFGMRECISLACVSKSRHDAKLIIKFDNACGIIGFLTYRNMPIG